MMVPAQFLIDVTLHTSHLHILAHMGFESEQEQELLSTETVVMEV